MAATVVTAVFGSKGEAENASHRLVSEGFAKDAIGIRVLKEVSKPPITMDPELDTLKLDPFIGLLGDVHKYASYIRNGETLLIVNAAAPDKAERAAALIREFVPEHVEVHEPGQPG